MPAAGSESWKYVTS